MTQMILGGTAFDLPPLPWRLVREIAPILGSASAGVLTAGNLAKVGEAAWLAARHARGGELAREAFDELPITFGEMVAAIPAIAEACGMKREGAADADEGKASTGQA